MRRTFNFRYRSAAHIIMVCRSWHVPVHKAFAELPAESSAALQQELLQLLTEMNVGGAHTLTVPSDYLEIVVVRA